LNPTEPAKSPGRKRRRRIRGAWLGAGAMIIAALIGLVSVGPARVTQIVTQIFFQQNRAIMQPASSFAPTSTGGPPSPSPVDPVATVIPLASPSPPVTAGGTQSEWLSDIGSYIWNDFSYHSAKLDTLIYSHSMVAAAGCGRSYAAEADINRAWTHLQGQVGLDDSSEDGVTADFAVFGDGVRLYDRPSVVVGHPIPLTANVTHVLHLKIVATVTSPRCGQFMVVFGDLLLSDG
jgi:NPCBM/NEW2 domain